MPVFSKTFSLVVFCCWVGGCSVQSAQEFHSPSVLPALTTEFALATFVDVCYGAAPSFRSYDEKTRGYERSPNGWRKHANFDFSVVLREDPSRYSCQVAFSSDEGQSAFISAMNTPFKAREVAGNEVAQLFQTNGSESVAIFTLVNVDRIFAAKTKFDGRSASFFGFSFKDQFSTPNGDKYGLMLQVSK